MQMNLYAIHDAVAETWGNIFTLAPKVAHRTFHMMKRDTSAADRADKTIYFVGTWDNETGVHKASEPVPVFTLYDQEEKKDG